MPRPIFAANPRANRGFEPRGSICAPRLNPPNRLKRKQIRFGQSEIFERLRTAGVGVNLHYIPIYRQPYYERLGFSTGCCPEAERYYAEAISLPMHPGLTESQQDTVVGALRAATTPIR